MGYGRNLHALLVHHEVRARHDGHRSRLAEAPEHNHRHFSRRRRLKLDAAVPQVSERTVAKAQFISTASPRPESRSSPRSLIACLELPTHVKGRPTERDSSRSEEESRLVWTAFGTITGPLGWGRLRHWVGDTD